jgi:putative hydrolase of the HAD superfamily
VLPEPRAVVFDLDDTLYPYRRFVLSGFATIAHDLQRAFGCDRRAAFRVLVRASRGPARGKEVQVCLAALQLPDHLGPPLAARIRDHQPALRLPRETAATLAALRQAGWRLGVVTNGAPAVQARKIAALGLMPWLNAVVYASEYGSGAGKPEPDAFFEIGRRLGVSPSATVVVGDSEDCDISGALAAGMHAIRYAGWTGRADRETRGAHRIDRLSRVPALARALVRERAHRHVA